jgi:hypothetical protein
VATTNQPSEQVTEVLGRALVDDDFRRMLYEDRTTALAQYELSTQDQQVVASIPRETLEQHAQTFREGSVVGAAVGIGIGVAGHFGAEDQGPADG